MPFQQAFAEPALLVAQRDPEASPGRDARALLLVESHALVGGPPPLLQSLTPRERELVLSHGRRRVLNRGQTVFNQGDPARRDLSWSRAGRIRVFYTRPIGTRDHAGLLASRQFRRGPGNLREQGRICGPVVAVDQQHRGATAGQGVARRW